MFRLYRNACLPFVSLNSLCSFMGRPKKSIEDKRSIQVLVKLTNSEYSQLLKLMIYAGTNASEVVRQLVFKERLLKPRVSLVDVQTYTELKRIGNNLNQYVKAVHQSKLTKVDQKILIELQETFEILTTQIIKQ